MPTLAYESAASAPYRPRPWRIVATMFLPWVVQAVVTALVYLTSTTGENHGPWLAIAFYGGVAGSCVAVARSGFRRPVKAILIVLLIPFQLICLFVVLDVVAMMFGATDAF